jgi:hypothetical protein
MHTKENIPPIKSLADVRQSCLTLTHEYHKNDPVILKAAETLSPYQFLRLFIITHGMKPAGNWQTHTYARFT